MTIFSGEGKGGALIWGGRLFRISHSTGALNRGRALIRGNTVFVLNLWDWVTCGEICKKNQGCLNFSRFMVTGIGASAFKDFHLGFVYERNLFFALHFKSGLNRPQTSHKHKKSPTQVSWAKWTIFSRVWLQFKTSHSSARPCYVQARRRQRRGGNHAGHQARPKNQNGGYGWVDFTIERVCPVFGRHCTLRTLF